MNSRKPNSLISSSFQSIWAYLYHAITSYLVIIIIARYLGKEQYGLYAFIVSILSWIELFTAEAFSNPIIQSVSRQEKKIFKSLLITQTLTAIFFTILFLLIASYLDILFATNGSTLIYRLAAIDILPFTIFGISSILLNAKDKYLKRMIVSNIYSTAKIVFMTIAVLLCSSVSSVFIGMALASLSAALAGGTYLRKIQLFSSEKKITSIKAEKSLLISLLLSLSFALILSGDIWILQYFTGSSAIVGEYSIAQNLARLLYYTGSGILLTIIPTVAKSQTILALKNENRIIINLFFLLLITGAAILSIFSKIWISLFFGDEFNNSQQYLIYLAPAYAILTIGIAQIQLLYHCNKKKISLIFAFLGISSFFIFGVIGLVNFGNSGIVLGHYLGGLVMLLAGIFLFL